MARRDTENIIRNEQRIALESRVDSVLGIHTESEVFFVFSVT